MKDSSWRSALSSVPDAPSSDAPSDTDSVVLKPLSSYRPSPTGAPPTRTRSITPSTPTLTAKVRTECVVALTLADLHAGKGTTPQQRAYQEYEWRRCAESYRYWRSRYAYLKLKSGDITLWSFAFPCQNEEADRWQAGVSTIDVKGRQTGQTSDAGHFAVWDCMFHDAVTWNIVGADEDAGKDILDRLQATLDRLPEWMLRRACRTYGFDRDEFTRRAAKQQSVLVISFGLSKLRVLTGAVRKLQGMSGKVLLDDFGKHLDQDAKWQLTYPVIDDPDPANRGQLITIFNGNGKDYAYHLYRRAKSGDIALHATFLPWMADPRRCEGLYTDADGRTRSPWYDNAEKQYMVEHPEADTYAFRAQYPETEEEAFFLHGNSRFDLGSLHVISEAIEREREASEAAGVAFPPKGLLETCGEGFSFHPHRNGRLRYYVPPAPEGVYCVAVDAAGGRTSGDWSVAMVGRVDGPCLEQVAVYEAKVEPTKELRDMAFNLGLHYNTALIIPETGSSGHGSSFCDSIKYDYPNIYRQIRTSRYVDEEKEELGYATSTGSRNRLIDSIAAALGRRTGDVWEREPEIVLHDPRTIEQLQHFEVNPKSGKAEAPKGENDDLVICVGLLIEGARNLALPKDTNLVNFAPWEW